MTGMDITGQTGATQGAIRRTTGPLERRSHVILR